jgi:hypothetical protein
MMSQSVGTQTLKVIRNTVRLRNINVKILSSNLQIYTQENGSAAFVIV